MLQIIQATWNNGSPSAEFNNAAQTWNHTFYWESIGPNGGGQSNFCKQASVPMDNVAQASAHLPLFTCLHRHAARLRHFNILQGACIALKWLMILLRLHQCLNDLLCAPVRRCSGCKSFFPGSQILYPSCSCLCLTVLCCYSLPDSGKTSYTFDAKHRLGPVSSTPMHTAVSLLAGAWT